MRSSNGTAGPTVDWREWVAFLGYVLASAVAISVALGSVVLLLSTHADDPHAGLGVPASARSSLPPASTVLRQGGVQAAEMDLGSSPRRERAPRAGSTATPDGTRSPVTASAAGASRVTSAASEGSSRTGATAAAEGAAASTASDVAPGLAPAANSQPLGKTSVLPASPPPEAAKAAAAGAEPGSSAAQNTAASASAIGLPGSGDTTQAFAAILQPIPEPSPSAAAILQPLAPALQPLGLEPSSEDSTLASRAGASAAQQDALGVDTAALSGT